MRLRRAISLTWSGFVEFYGQRTHNRHSFEEPSGVPGNDRSRGYFRKSVPKAVSTFSPRISLTDWYALAQSAHRIWSVLTTITDGVSYELGRNRCKVDAV